MQRHKSEIVYPKMLIVFSYCIYYRQENILTLIFDFYSFETPDDSFVDTQLRGGDNGIVFCLSIIS